MSWRDALTGAFFLHALLICLCRAQQASVPAHPQDNLQATNFAAQSGSTAIEPFFCFVIRTYWGHGDQHGSGLRKLIRSLQRQNHSRWEAVLLVADSTPFPDLHSILNDLNDTRAWVFAEWIAPEFAPKSKGEWTPGYHGLLYNLTDDAIQVCPQDTEWLVVTNGDNEYGSGFLDRVLKEVSLPNLSPKPTATANNSLTPPLEVDIVAFDFYSRYMRPTMPACERFSASLLNSTSETVRCKRNHLRWCQSDLGAAAIRWQRFSQESRRFGDLDGSKYGLGAEHFDGIMMEALREGGWHSKRVSDLCLFVHAPSMQSCIWSGGAWDDRDIRGTGGGECVTQEQADKILLEDFEAEDVRIDTASDGDVGTFEGASQEALEGARCLRKRNYRSEVEWGRRMLWFSELCTDEEDLAAFHKQIKEFYPNAAALAAAENELGEDTGDSM